MAETAPPPRTPDRFTTRYALLSAALALLLAGSHDLDRIFNLYILLVPILLIPTLIYLLGMLVALVWTIVSRRWRHMASVILGPLLVATVSLMLRDAGIGPTYVRFELGKSAYLTEMASIPAVEGRPRVRVWDWGDTGGAAVPNLFSYLVYDETGEITLPMDARSAAWRDEVDRHASGNASNMVVHGFPSETPAKAQSHLSVSHMSGYFYVVTAIY